MGEFLCHRAFEVSVHSPLSANNYFGRTYDGAEIDWIEERAGALYAYEFKWNPKKKVKIPRSWQQAYPEATWPVITPRNAKQLCE